jgi:predicted transcriptional regulator
LSRPPWLLAVLLLVPLSSASSAALPALQVTFAEPAQAQGLMEVREAHWVLVVFRGTAAGLRVDLGAATARNQTWLELNDHRSDGNGSFMLPVPEPPVVQAFAGGIHGRLAPAAPWASLYLEADAIRLEFPQVDASLVGVRADSYASSYLPEAGYPPRAVNPPQPPASPPGSTQPYRELRVHEPGAALSIQGPKLGASFPFSMHASGVTRLEWHNQTLACESACPDSGRPSSTVLDFRGRTRLERLSYIDVESATGSVEGEGSALGIATGASILEVSLIGDLRLPDAQISGECPKAECPNPDGKTFQAQGNLLLSRLASDSSESSRLRMGISGKVTTALFDETVIYGFTLAEKVAVGAAIVIGGGCLVLLGLFARSARPPALRHPKRQTLFQLIQDAPGLSSRELQRRLDWPRGTLLFHLQRLVEDGHVSTQPHKNTVRYFETKSRHASSWRKVVQLQDSDANRLHVWLTAHPGIGQTQITQDALKWGWDRNKVRRHLSNLQAAELLSSRREGRRVLYTAKPGLLADWMPANHAAENRAAA